MWFYENVGCAAKYISSCVYFRFILNDLESYRINKYVSINVQPFGDGTFKVYKYCPVFQDSWKTYLERL